MDYRKFGDRYVIRLDKGEEIAATLKDFCRKEHVTLGAIRAFGAVNRVELGLFKTVEKEYFIRTMEGDFEITALLGNISTMDGEIYLHMHITLSDIENRAYGGHMNKAFVSATVEAVVEVMDGTVDRAFDDEVGLNLFRFDQ